MGDEGVGEGRRGGVSGRLPTLVAEALGVVFAVLVALAVDEWWEERENVELAERATVAIASEIRENRAELMTEVGPERVDEMAATLDSAIAGLRRGEEPEGLEVDWNLALLSAAAWETAQVTRATQYMPLERVVGIAQVYDFQRLYSASQDRLFEQIVGIGSRMEGDRVVALLELRSHLLTTSALRGTLANVYACTLTDLEGADAPESEDCPRDDAAGG